MKEIYARTDGAPSVGYQHESYERRYRGVWYGTAFSTWQWEGPMFDGEWDAGQVALHNHYHRVYHWSDLSPEQQETCKGTPLEELLLPKGIQELKDDELWPNG